MKIHKMNGDEIYALENNYLLTIAENLNRKDLTNLYECMKSNGKRRNEPSWYMRFLFWDVRMKL